MHLIRVGEQVMRVALAKESGQFGSQMQAAQYADQQRAQQVAEQLGYGGQGFDQQMQQANFQNLLRQAGISEQQQLEGWDLNKMNALISGQQVGMPQMPNFTPVARPATPDYLGAATAQGNYDAQNSGNMFGALGNIGAGLATGGAFNSLFPQ